MFNKNKNNGNDNDNGNGKKPQSSKGSNPPSAKGSNPPSAKGSNPSSAKGSNPPSDKGSNPPSVKGSNPPSVKGSNPPSVKGSNPPSVKGSNPPSLKGSNPPSGVPSRAGSRTGTPDLESRGRDKANVGQPSKSKSREPSDSPRGRGQYPVSSSSESSTADFGIMLPRGTENRSPSSGRNSTPVSRHVSPNSKDKQGTVLYVQEGSGGTFNFRGTSAKGNSLGDHELIGLDRCMSCLGIYFQIDSDRCFVAHLNAGIPGMAQGRLEDGQKHEIYRAVLDRLSQEAKTYDWKPSAVDKSTVILVSSFIYGPAKPAMKAVQAFLGKDTPSLRERAWGFVVKPGAPNGVRVLRSVPEEVHHYYEQDEAKLEEGAWAYTTGGRGWRVPEQLKDPFRSDSD